MLRNSKVSTHTCNPCDIYITSCLDYLIIINKKKGKKRGKGPVTRSNSLVTIGFTDGCITRAPAYGNLIVNRGNVSRHGQAVHGRLMFMLRHAFECLVLFGEWERRSNASKNGRLASKLRYSNWHVVLMEKGREWRGASIDWRRHLVKSSYDVSCRTNVV